MSQTRMETANPAAGPNDPPAPEPTHDVPVYPEHDPPPDQENAVSARGEEDDQPVQGTEPGEGQDVDEDDLDPKVPHSPPDAGKRNAAQRNDAQQKVIFDENKMAG